MIHTLSLFSLAGLALASALSLRAAQAPSAAPPDFSRVPGVVVDYSPAASGLYVGSPSLAVLPNGDYVASHDYFGPKSNEHVSARSAILRSADRGRTWLRVAEIQGAFWSKLFVHRGALYLLGTDRHHGDAVVRRSTDGGTTWTNPTDATSGRLRAGGEYHCAPMPVVEHQGRLWRTMEWRHPPEKWGVNYRAGMLSIPVEGDLLRADQWTFAEFLPSYRAWNGGDMGAWLEGNAVITPAGDLVNVLRVATKSPDEKAAIVRVSADGRALNFDPDKDFVAFPLARKSSRSISILRRRPIGRSPRLWRSGTGPRIPGAFAIRSPSPVRPTCGRGPCARCSSTIRM